MDFPDATSIFYTFTECNKFLSFERSDFLITTAVAFDRQDVVQATAP